MTGVLVRLIDAVVTLYSFVVIARAFLPLIGADTYNPIVRFIYDITEPVLAPLRRFMVFGMWDFSPLGALILLTLLRQILVGLLVNGLR
jgi:YggT family protein